MPTFQETFDTSVEAYNSAKAIFTPAAVNLVAGSDGVVSAAQALITDLQAQIAVLNASLSDDGTKLALLLTFKDSVSLALDSLEAALNPPETP